MNTTPTMLSVAQQSKQQVDQLALAMEYLVARAAQTPETAQHDYQAKVDKVVKSLTTLLSRLDFTVSQVNDTWHAFGRNLNDNPLTPAEDVIFALGQCSGKQTILYDVLRLIRAALDLIQPGWEDADLFVPPPNATVEFKHTNEYHVDIPPQVSK